MQYYLIHFLTELLVFSTFLLYLTKGREFPKKVGITIISSMIFALLSSGVYGAGVFLCKLSGLL